MFVHLNKTNEIDNQSMILSHINKIENQVQVYGILFSEKEFFLFLLAYFSMRKNFSYFFLQRLFVLITCCRIK